jgi:hypothetical protein
MFPISSKLMVRYIRYSHVVSCDDFDFFNETICENIVRATPNCLDALQLAEEQPTIQNKLDAFEKDCAVVYSWDDPVSGKNPYDAREKVRSGIIPLIAVTYLCYVSVGVWMNVSQVSNG